MRRYLFLIFSMLAAPAFADDIDIYLNPTRATGAEPMVMFSLDYRSNLSSTVCGGTECDGLIAEGYLAGKPTTRFNLYRAVLKKVFAGLSGVRVGLMLSHANNNNCAGPSKTGCSNGGYVLSGFQTLQAGDANGAKRAFADKLAAVPDPQGNVSHPYQGKELFFEFFRYLSGQGIYNAHNAWTDFGTTNAYNLDQPQDYTPNTGSVPLKWDASIENAGNYVSPVASECAKIYTVNFLFAVSNQESDSDSAIRASKAAGGMGGIDLTSTNNNFATVIRWMYHNDVNYSFNGRQKVTSYFVVEQDNNTTRGFAGAGIGLTSTTPYRLSDDPNVLINTLNSIFRTILSTSTTFVAPAVAVNVYNRAQVRNEVYIAMFQAEENGYPNWPGNLKKYAIAKNADGALEIQDVNGSYAVAADGRIDYDALSYWTRAGDLPAPAANSTDVAGKDGRAVKRGGAGAKIPGYKRNCTSPSDTVCAGLYSPGLVNPSPAATATTEITARKLFTEPDSFTNGTASALRPLNADTTTAAALKASLGVADTGACASTDATTTACALLTFARGARYNGTTVVARDWIMGDLLHSRPIAINYGARGSYTATNPDIRLIAGSNDGFLHMFRNTKAGQTDPKLPNDTDGVEAWAFMPRAVMPTLRTLINETTAVTPPHPYTVDGAPSAYIYDADADGNIETGDKVYLYFGLRRGGTSYYAFDITDPDDPRLLWRIDKGASGSAFAELGQTWSTPRLAKMLYDNSNTPRPVVIFAGGYDPNKDTHSGHGSYTTTAMGTDDSQGNAIFIVNAETGALIWKAIKGAATAYDATTKAYSRPDLRDSIPSDVAAIDTDGNKLVDRLYVGDTGGVLWRADMRHANQANWTLTPILSVGRHANTGLANDRRFFYPPDYVQTKDATGAFDGLVIGTGDRENPLDVSVTNWVFMFKDRNINSGSLGAYSYPETDVNLANVTDYTYANTLDLNKGWRLQLVCPPTAPATCGEKNLATALTLNGRVYFTTYKPPASATGASCSLSEGSGLLYAVSLQLGKAVEDFDATNNTATQTLFAADRYKELASGGIPAEVVSLGGGKILRPDLTIHDTATDSGLKTFWYEKTQ